MHRRYSRFTARLTVAGDTPKDLATRRWLTPLATISMTAASCSSDNRRGAPSFLPSAFAFCKPRLGTAADGHQFLVGHPSGEAGQGIAQERLRRIGVGIQVLGPGLFVIGQAANPDPAPLQVVDVAHGVQPAPPDPVDGHHNQGVTLSQPGVQRVPAPPAVGTGGTGDADVLIDVRACLQSLQD